MSDGELTKRMLQAFDKSIQEPSIRHLEDIMNFVVPLKDSWDLLFEEAKQEFHVLFNELFLGKLSYEEYTREVNMKINKWFGAL